jgi:tRNA-2-methylthio-N6-dimethylallyladenosine synthase
VAAKMGDKVDEVKKSSRLSTLQSLQKQISLKKNKALEGKRLEVLVEGYSKRGGQISGRTGSNKVVNFIGDNSYIAKSVTVTIKHGFLNSLHGELAF